jgi:alpha-tubulin suppressor-like RCC1 family protein
VIFFENNNDHIYSLATGEVYSFGDNQYGQLGIGGNLSTTSPSIINSLSGVGIAQISAGDGFSLALTGN